MAMKLCPRFRLGSILRNHSRFASSESPKTAHLVGVYTSEDQSFQLTKAAEQIDASSSGNLKKLLQCGGHMKSGSHRLLYGVSSSHPVVCAVSLDTKTDEGLCASENRDLKRENVRTAVASGFKALSSLPISQVSVDPCDDGEAAAEGAVLSSYVYQALKSKKKDIPLVECSEASNSEFKRGVTLGAGQNLARFLMDSPANVMTPTQFAQEAVTSLEHLGVEVQVRSYEWAKSRKMNAFLSVSRGSSEPPVFLEMNYKGTDHSEQHIALVGKGVTFDSGGISIKPSANMDKMRADMGGAACVVGALQSIAALRMPINVRAYIPLCENLLSGSATKPGDVVVASNWKSIQIDNTDAEGRLILADALVHASKGNPKAMVDLATLTGAMAVALGTGATGVFTSSNSLYSALEKAGQITGDRVWRMPLWDTYTKQISDTALADLNNVGTRSRDGGSCTAAAFLKEFVTCPHWVHMDIAGVMESSDDVPYIGKGMSGRPTRTIAQFAHLLSTGEMKL